MATIFSAGAAARLDPGKAEALTGTAAARTWSAKIEATPEGDRHRSRPRCGLGARARRCRRQTRRNRVPQPHCRHGVDLPAADGQARCRELDRERAAQGARRDRQEGQARRDAGLQAARLRAGRRAGADRRHARRYRQGAARLCRHGRIPGEDDRAMGDALPRDRGDRLLPAAADHAARRDGAASRPCSGCCRSWCRGR